MKPVVILLGLGAALFPYLVHSEEPKAMPIYSGEEAVSSVAKSEKRSVVSSRLMDEEDMNFDNLDFDAMGEPMNAASEAKPQAKPKLPPAPPAPQVDKTKTLSDNLEANSSASTDDSVIPLPNVEETWISKISSSTSSDENASSEEKATPTAPSGKVNLESLVEKSKKTVRRSNASVFDISGAMLRMSFQQIDDVLTKRGFRRTTQKMDIPNFIRWRNEDKCRASGVVGYERLENCVIQIARKNGHQYVERTSYSKYKTREEIDVQFTSTFTGNKAYRIAYKSEAATAITGNSQKQIYLRNIKVYDFWKKINQKYGIPDNKDDVIWGLGGNKAYMQAGTGRLILEDPMLRELDYTRMSREDQKYMNTDLYSF